MREFHPAIRVVHETPELVKAFAPLVYVPANFVFDKTGKRIFGDGKRNPINAEDLMRIIGTGS